MALSLRSAGLVENSDKFKFLSLHLSLPYSYPYSLHFLKSYSQPTKFSSNVTSYMKLSPLMYTTMTSTSNNLINLR